MSDPDNVFKGIFCHAKAQRTQRRKEKITNNHLNFASFAPLREKERVCKRGFQP
jgi:hypothetical protein